MTSTGDKGFVSFNGTEYVVSDQIFQQFQAGYEQAGQAGARQNQSLATLGIDPRKWLTNAKNAGEAKVGDTDTIKITGDVDVPKLLDDVNTALAKLRSLGGARRGEPARPADRASRSSRSPTRSRTSASRSTPARRTGSCAAWSSALKRRRPEDAAQQPLRRASSTCRCSTSTRTRRSRRPDERQAVRRAARSCSAARHRRPRRPRRRAAAAGPAAGPPTEQNLEKYSECVQDAGGDNAKGASAPTC